MDWYWWLVGWAVLWGRGSVRQALNTRHQRKLQLVKAEAKKQRAIERAKRPPEAICGCTHHLAKHDRQGKCHELVEAPTGWDGDRKPVGFEARPCACQQYIGPRPLETIYAEEIIDPS